MSQIFGFLNIDKPLNVTSHDIVARIRRELGVRKVGHAGTLDPLATGVLVMCLGSATRLSEYVMHTTKRYLAQVHFGISTTTDDAEGVITDERDASHLTRSAVEAALPAFTGAIMQTPPDYSAIKLGGRKAYELARAGKPTDLRPRQVQIDALRLDDWQPPVALLDVTCSSGTYIRSLARDLGAALGTGAYLSGLRRMMSGCFRIEDAHSLDAVLADPDWRRHLIGAERALPDWRRVLLDAEASVIVGHGGAVTLDADDIRAGELALAFASGGALLAVIRAEGDQWVPQKVFWRD